MAHFPIACDFRTTERYGFDKKNVRFSTFIFRPLGHQTLRIEIQVVHKLASWMLFRLFRFGNIAQFEDNLVKQNYRLPSSTLKFHIYRLSYLNAFNCNNSGPRCSQMLYFRKWFCNLHYLKHYFNIILK